MLEERATLPEDPRWTAYLAELQKHNPDAHVVTRYDTVVEKYLVNAVERGYGVVEREVCETDDLVGDARDRPIAEVAGVYRSRKSAAKRAADWDGDVVNVVVLGTTQDLPDTV